MKQGMLTIRVLDVGHGDSIIIQFPDGISHSIIDCNRKGSAKGAKNGAAKYFKERLDKKLPLKIEFACLSHPHADHYTGYADLLESLLGAEVPIREYWDFGASVRKAQAMAKLPNYSDHKRHVDELFRLCKVKAQLEEHDAIYRILSTPQNNFWNAQGVSVSVLAPASDHYESYTNFLALTSKAERQRFLAQFPHSSNDNLVCSALGIRFGTTEIILGGDLTNDAWAKLLKVYRQANSSIACHALKLSHHGSLDGNFPFRNRPLCQFLNSPRGLIAMISGGYRANLPHGETLAALQNGGCQLFCTGRIQKDTVSRAYRPKANVPAEVLAHMEADEIVELTDIEQTGHGDIVLECTADGQCSVSTQFEFLMPTFSES